ncbi:MAG: 4Fe-4S binding protein [Clostridia bacterium]|nr:4Fe-4S binding protein [Clostridia bacterium]
MIDKNKCISCGSCVSACPVGAIKFDENGKAEIDPNICIKCGTCEAICPVGAIKIER